MKLKGNTLYSIWIGLIYIISQNFLYLVPNSSMYSRIATIIMLLLFCHVFFIKYKKFVVHKFTFLMICPILLSVLASIRECILYSDASFLNSLFSQAQWWIYGLIYIISSELLYQKAIDTIQLEKTLVYIGTTQVIIAIVQYFLQDYFLFTHINTSARLGETRFRFPIVMMCFVCMWAVGKFFKGDNKIKSIILIFAVLFESFFVQQFRSTTIGLVASMGIGFLIWRKPALKKIIIVVTITIVAFIIYLKSPFLQMSIQYMIGRNDYSLGVRGININWLIQNIIQNPIFGNGWISSGESFYYSATGYRLYTNVNSWSFADGGIFSIAYSYGIFGLTWVIVLWYKMLKNGLKIIQNENDYTYFVFPLYMVITMAIDIHWYIFDQFYIMAIFCAISETKIQKYNEAYKKAKVIKKAVV